MKKTLLLLIVLLSFINCGGKDSSSSSNEDYSYGDGVLQDLPELLDEYAPEGLSDKVIVSGGNNHAPMDLLTQELTLTFDPVAQTAKGHSVIQFRVRKPGRPYFELQATVKNLTLDSVATTVSTITDPDGQSQSYRSVGQEVAPGSIHKVEFDYELASGRVTFTGGGVRFLTDMTDLSGKFFEYWGPVGFEEDGFALKLNLVTPNATSSHTLRTNGTITASADQNWEVTFPYFYSKSSFYVHLTNQVLPSQKLVVKGLEKDIPVEIYGLTDALVNSAVAVVPKLFAELEKDYGPYAHDKFLAYMNDRSGGMEYVGATITSLASIDHELLHSWFARSVIPADGRSGWIDEAMASWRDYGYSKGTTLLSRTPTNMADYSPFKKSTPSNVYVDGRALMAELDYKMADFGGMKPIMKEFYKRYKNKVVNNEEFWQFLGDYTKIDVQPFNERYALGAAEEVPTGGTPPEGSKHPTPLTEDEILRLR